MTQWHLNPIVSGYGLLFLVAMVAAATLVPTFKSLPRWQWGTLTALRVAVVLLALTLMLRPTRISTNSRPVSALLVILFDQSRSMTVPDMGDGSDRWQAQRELLDQAAQIAAEMTENSEDNNIEVKFYGFDDAAQEMELTAGALVLPTVPEGKTTDHGSSLDDVLRKERGKRLAAVFLLGDGAQRAYAPRVEMQQAASQVERLGAPLYTVALGKDIEQSQARDVAIENLLDHHRTFVKNEVAIRASLAIRGFINTPIATQLVIEDAAGKQTVLGPVNQMISEEGKMVPLEFTFTPEEPGQYRLTLTAAEQSGELVTKNNRMTSFLTVRDGGLKVLLLTGTGTLGTSEYNFIRRAIDSSEDIQFDADWIEFRNRARWPRDFVERFRDPEYDVIIFGDVPAAAISPESINALAESVENAGPDRRVGKGFMMYGGEHSFGPGGWAGTEVGDMLPVILDRRELQDFDAPLRKDRHWMQRLPMLPAQRHFTTNLAATPVENDALWRSLESLENANRFDRLHPQAMVLAETDDEAPLLLARSYGDGRVLAFAGDSTWRWSMQGQVDAHRRFWRNCVLWLAGRDEDQKDTVWIDLSQRRYNPGGRVEFETGIRRGDGGDADAISLQAEVVLPNGSRKAARLAPEGDRYLGLFKETDLAGNYTIEVTIAGQAEPAARTRFVVLDEDLELGNPSANPDALAAMAEVTQEFGGRRVSSEEMLELLREIKNSPPELQEEVQERFELGRSLGTAWLFFFAILGLLTGEWYLRKRWHLV